MQSKESDGGDAAVDIPAMAATGSSLSSIYDLISPKRRHAILLAAAFASMLVPFSDTVYLPALQVGVCDHVGA